ncbi:hypothetical protein FH972_025463 [Carpinus fangiana]|uniref:Glutathione transferase n=1 Tax=Carpinus fangiana TaxID=176857 RepID=A0A5N6L176_9ROSI|nr:hypothetical protein FH972_025463 [Carpinus fangiana]
MASTEAKPDVPSVEPTAAAAEGGPVITLHWLEKSRSHRILWLLEELHVTYVLKTYKRGSDFLAPPELKKVHPLGKSPVISVKPAPDQPEFVIAESALIIEYLSQYFGGWLVPQQYRPGFEGKIGGETPEWLRYRFLMHYGEGSLMTLLLMALTAEGIRKAPVPFFIKPITKRVASGIEDQFLTRNFATHFSFLEEQLKTAPGGGPFFCGTELTGADVLMIFPLEAALQRGIIDGAKMPQLKAWVERIIERPAYKRAVDKIVEATGEYNPVIS